MENSATKLSENTEKEASTASALEKEQLTGTDDDKGETAAQETAANDSGTDEKILDQTVEEQSEKSKDGNHSDPETGELGESLLLSIKEPCMDFTDNRKISVEVEADDTSEVGSLSCEKLVGLSSRIIIVGPGICLG